MWNIKYKKKTSSIIQSYKTFLLKNKLECLFLSCFPRSVVSPGAYPHREVLKGTPPDALLTNIRLVWKNWPGTNTLAYFQGSYSDQWALTSLANVRIVWKKLATDKHSSLFSRKLFSPLSSDYTLKRYTSLKKLATDKHSSLFSRKLEHEYAMASLTNIKRKNLPRTNTLAYFWGTCTEFSNGKYWSRSQMLD